MTRLLKTQSYRELYGICGKIIYNFFVRKYFVLPGRSFLIEGWLVKFYFSLPLNFCYSINIFVVVVVVFYSRYTKWNFHATLYIYST